jgi:hypothetical protein
MTQPRTWNGPPLTADPQDAQNQRSLLAKVLDERDDAVARYREFALPILGEARAFTPKEIRQNRKLENEVQVLEERVDAVYAEVRRDRQIEKARVAANRVDKRIAKIHKLVADLEADGYATDITDELLPDSPVRVVHVGDLVIGRLG